MMVNLGKVYRLYFYFVGPLCPFLADEADPRYIWNFFPHIWEGLVWVKPLFSIQSEPFSQSILSLFDVSVYRLKKRQMTL